MILLLLLTLLAQAPASLPIPTLTTEQKLQIQNVAQKMQIAQLQSQAAQRDFDAARVELQTLLKSLEKDGYTLDLQTLTYTKKEPSKKDQ
jgi:hypothetical protein